MKCPNCSAVLVITTRSDVEIDYCPECRGIWLDRGELDKIIERMKVARQEEYADRRPVRFDGDDDRRPVRFDGDDDRRPVRFDDDDDRRPVRYDDDDQTARKNKKRGMFGEIFDIFG